MSSTDFAPFAAAALPPVVVAYLTAHDDGRHDDAAALFTASATVLDDGRTYEGRDAIRAWLERASSEYTYTSRPVSQRLEDAAHVTVVNHLEGDFPGGTVDLRHQFTLEDGAIARLAIEV
jgi:hypothetical protein